MTSLEVLGLGNYDVRAGGGDVIIGEDTGRAINQISGSIPVELCKLPNLGIFS